VFAVAPSRKACGVVLFCILVADLEIHFKNLARSLADSCWQKICKKSMGLCAALNPVVRFIPGVKKPAQRALNQGGFCKTHYKICGLKPLTRAGPVGLRP
jgi:hypothetical protein